MYTSIPTYIGLFLQRKTYFFEPMRLFDPITNFEKNKFRLLIYVYFIYLTYVKTI